MNLPSSVRPEDLSGNSSRPERMLHKLRERTEHNINRNKRNSNYVLRCVWVNGIPYINRHRNDKYFYRPSEGLDFGYKKRLADPVGETRRHVSYSHCVLKQNALGLGVSGPSSMQSTVKADYRKPP